MLGGELGGSARGANAKHWVIAIWVLHLATKKGREAGYHTLRERHDR